MLRLFFALQPTAPQSAALIEQVMPLVTRLKAQRVPPDNLHATLCFIGSVEEEKLPLLESLAAKLHASCALLRFDRLEHWHTPRVLVATAVDCDESAPANALARQLAVAAHGGGFSPDVKPFRAHLTLARKVDAGRARACAWPQALTPATVVHCDHFALMQSRRGASGSTYSVVKSWPLYAENTDSRSANIQ